jgi:hypothetical protein
MGTAGTGRGIHYILARDINSSDKLIDSKEPETDKPINSQPRRKPKKCPDSSEVNQLKLDLD